MKLTRGEDNQIDWIKQRDDARSSVGLIPPVPRPKKHRLTKREKALRQRLLKPTPIPSDDRLISLRRLTQLDGSFYDISNVCDQVISMRQELAEIKEMIREIQEETP